MRRTGAVLVGAMLCAAALSAQTPAHNGQWIGEIGAAGRVLRNFHKGAEGLYTWEFGALAPTNTSVAFGWSLFLQGADKSGGGLRVRARWRPTDRLVVDIAPGLMLGQTPSPSVALAVGTWHVAATATFTELPSAKGARRSLYLGVRAQDLHPLLTLGIPITAYLGALALYLLSGAT